jgi:hypothetical protein
MVLMVLMAPKVQLVLLENKDRQELMVKMVLMAHKVLLVQPELKVPPVLME